MREMENAATITLRQETEILDTQKFPIMRALARFHECDAETLFGSVDASELDVHEILREMVSKEEVQASAGRSSGERFTLTRKGWAEYMNVLSSIYVLPE